MPGNSLETGTGATCSLDEIINRPRITPYQFGIVLLCFLSAVIDGLDNLLIGFATPAMSLALKIPLGSFGLVFSAGLVGSMIGALAMGTIADRIGRRLTLSLCTLLFGLLTVALVEAENLPTIVALRFLAGIGLGGALPCFLTLASEFTPKYCRALALSVIWCGNPVGGMLGGFSGSFLLPIYGWQSVFLIGGVLAIAMAAVQMLLLPESIEFLAGRPQTEHRIRAIVQSISPGLEAMPVLNPPPGDSGAAARAGARELFTPKYRRPTLLLWVVMFCTYMMTSFFVLWLPSLFTRSGIEVGMAAFVVAIMNTTALPSQALAGFVIDRIGPFRLITMVYLALGTTVVGLALSLGLLPAVTALMMLIGALIGPIASGSVFLSTQLYSDRVRSTGAGWATALGRAGQVSISIVVGLAVRSNVPSSTIIAMMAVPCLVAWIAAVYLRKAARSIAL